MLHLGKFQQLKKEKKTSRSSSDVSNPKYICVNITVCSDINGNVKGRKLVFPLCLFFSYLVGPGFPGEAAAPQPGPSGSVFRSRPGRAAWCRESPAPELPAPAWGFYRVGEKVASGRQLLHQRSNAFSLCGPMRLTRSSPPASSASTY